MELLVKRQPGAATPGELLIDGRHFCWTLEDPVRAGPKVAGDTAIPAGRYKVTIDMSTRFKRPMLHVLDVPNFAGIRIHNGCTPANTEGCLLVNYHRDPLHPAWLADFNRQAMLDLEARVKEALARAQPVWIQYVNQPEKEKA